MNLKQVTGTDIMLDIAMLTIAFASFAALFGYLFLCDSL